MSNWLAETMNRRQLPLKVLLIGNYEPDGSESMKRFTILLESNLRKMDHFQVRTVVPKTLAGRLSPRNRELRKILGGIDKLIFFPRTLKRHLGWADVVHIVDHSNAIYTKYLHGKRHLVTCHDVLAIASALGKIPEHRTRWTGKRLQAMILKGLNAAHHVACVSHETARQLMLLGKIQSASTTVIENGLNYPYAPMLEDEANAHLRALGVPEHADFFMHIGSNQWYKNRSAVIRAFAIYVQANPRCRTHLLMVGKTWTDEMRAIVRENALHDRVYELITLSNEQVRALYSRAALLIFPSLREGFGWPVIEAQACGCPVVTSNRAPMTDIAGQTAVYVDPLQPSSIAVGVGEALLRRNELRELGITNAQRFSTNKMVSAYAALYRDLATGISQKNPPANVSG